MTTVIKGGTIVTADMTYESDVLIDGGVITAIGKDLNGDTGQRQRVTGDFQRVAGGVVWHRYGLSTDF